MAQDPDAYPADAVHTSHYILPYDLIGRRDRVLILGSGAGNDTASALFQGARFVRAVEIDPQIVRWGKERHPNHPYTSANVSAEVEDARAWLHRDSEKYDLIWIGLLDAQTGSSAYTSVRLDHYVYTRESMQEIRDHLAPGGIAVVYFGIAGRLWIADRLANTLRETYGTYPLAMRVVSESPCLGSGGFMLMAGNPEDVAKAKARAMAKPLSARMVLPVESWPGTMEPASDDWPYFYLKGRGVPKYHVVVGLACLLLAFVLGWRLRLGMDFSRLTMILLGMGFMLLEISGVSRAALLYGTTWAVNSYVVASILGMALLANFVASRFRYFPFGWPLIGLLASLGLLTWLPPAWFLGFSLPMRIVAGGLFLALPVFFSGLVFVRQWSQLKQKDVALGYNMIGSLVGGVLSMLSMWLGFKALLMITIAIYIAAFVSGRRGAGSSS
jgi:spermidine synthase